MNPKDIIESDYFSRFFPPQPETVARVERRMKEVGFDPSEPLVLGYGPWAAGDVLVDGYTRRLAAVNVGFTDVPVRRIYFETREDALKYRFHRRFARHPHSDGDILNAVEALEEHLTDLDARYRPTSGTNLPAPETLDESQERAERGAYLLGIDVRTYQQCMVILTCPEEKIQDSIVAGELSLDKTFLSFSKTTIKARVTDGELTIEEAYRQVRYYATRLKSAREKMALALIEGKPVNVPKYWLDEGWCLLPKKSWTGYGMKTPTPPGTSQAHCKSPTTTANVLSGSVGRLRTISPRPLNSIWND